MKPTLSTLALALLLCAPARSAENPNGPFTRVDRLISQFNDQYAEMLKMIKAGQAGLESGALKMPDFAAEKEALAKDRATLAAWKPVLEPHVLARQKAKECVATEDPRQTYGSQWKDVLLDANMPDIAEQITLLTICKSLARRDDPLSCASAGPLLNVTPSGATEPTVRVLCEDTRVEVGEVRAFHQGKFQANCPHLLRTGKGPGPLVKNMAPALVAQICSIAAQWNADPKAPEKLSALIGRDHPKLLTMLREGLNKTAGRFPPNAIPKDWDPYQSHASLFSYWAHKAKGDAKGCGENSWCRAYLTGDEKVCDKFERSVRQIVCSRYLSSIASDKKLSEASEKDRKAYEMLQQRISHQAQLLETKSRVAAQQLDLAIQQNEATSDSFRMVMAKKMAELRQTLDDAMNHLYNVEPKSLGGIQTRRAQLLKFQQRLQPLQQSIEAAAKATNRPVPKPASRR
jgi:hypothetical protein